jgi:hypothetical protein
VWWHLYRRSIIFTRPPRLKFWLILRRRQPPRLWGEVKSAAQYQPLPTRPGPDRGRGRQAEPSARAFRQAQGPEFNRGAQAEDKPPGACPERSRRIRPVIVEGLVECEMILPLRQKTSYSIVL